MVPLTNIGTGACSARRCGFALVCLLGLLSWPVSGEQSNRPAGQAVAPVEGPRLQMKERELEFGEIRRGTPIEAVFTVENVGTETLHILRVQPG